MQCWQTVRRQLQTQNGRRFAKHSAPLSRLPVSPSPGNFECGHLYRCHCGASERGRQRGEATANTRVSNSYRRRRAVSLCRFARVRWPNKEKWRADKHSRVRHEEENSPATIAPSEVEIQAKQSKNCASLACTDLQHSPCKSAQLLNKCANICVGHCIRQPRIAHLTCKEDTLLCQRLASSKPSVAAAKAAQLASEPIEHTLAYESIAAT